MVGASAKPTANNTIELQLRAQALLCALLNAWLGVTACAWPHWFAGHWRWVVGLGITLAILTIAAFRTNLVFQARLMLLITIGYYAGLVKAIDPDAAFSPVQIDAQTLEVGIRMFGLSSVALLGASMGFLASGVPLAPLRRPAKGIVMDPVSARLLFWSSAAIVVLTGYLSAKSYGPSVLVASYASGEGEGQLLGNLQSIGVISLVMCCVAGSVLKSRRVTWTLIGLGIYYLGWGILIRGGRLEVLSGLFALFVGLPAARGVIVRLRPFHYLIIVMMAALLEAWGTLRSTLAEGSSTGETVVEGYQRLADIGIYHAGTISGIATTFSNILHMIEKGIVEFQFGSTYLDYLLRSPPEFIYPNRPADLSWMFERYGYDAIGGFFELAEAYFNFGMLGCLVVPFVISYFIGISYRKALRGRVLWFVLLIALLSIFFRGAWYQSFAFYKGVLTGLTLYLAARAAGFLYSSRLPRGTKRLRRAQTSNA